MNFQLSLLEKAHDLLHQHDHLGLGHHEDDNHPENHEDEEGEDPVDQEVAEAEKIEKVEIGEDGGGFMAVGKLVKIDFSRIHFLTLKCHLGEKTTLF